MTILKDKQGNEWEQVPHHTTRYSNGLMLVSTQLEEEEKVIVIRKLPKKRVPFEEIDKFTDENSDRCFSEKTKKMARLIVKEALAQMEEKKAGPTQSTKP